MSPLGWRYGVGLLTAGFDVGGTKLLGVVVDAAGTVLAEARRPTATGPDEVFSDLVAMLGELGAEAPGVAALGVGAAGLVDLDGVMHRAPNLPGWNGVAVRARLVELVDLPVAVDNDANTAAYGELVHGAARGHAEVLVVTLGTGIGGGVISGGRVQRGGRGFAAEVGHFTVDPAGPPCACGGAGHWESIASGGALGRMGRDWAGRGHAPQVLHLAGGDPRAVTGEHVGTAARSGDPDAVALLERFAAGVAVGLGGLVNILDPELVVVAGGLVELGELLLGPVVAALPAHVIGAGRRPVPPVVGAALGERAGAVGAAALARAVRQ